MKTRKITKSSLKEEVAKLRSKRLIALTAMVERNEYVVLYQFDDKDLFMLELRFPKKEHHVDSIVDIFPGADIMERELHDLFGIEFDGNPNMEHKLFLADDWKAGPPRRDA